MRLTRPSLYTSVPVTNESQDLPGKPYSVKSQITWNHVKSREITSDAGEARVFGSRKIISVVGRNEIQVKMIST